jgi:hypothetical protein
LSGNESGQSSRRSGFAFSMSQMAHEGDKQRITTGGGGG